MYEVQKARAEAGRSELRATVADEIEAVFVAWPWTRAGRRDRTTVRQNQRAWLPPTWLLSMVNLDAARAQRQGWKGVLKERGYAMGRGSTPSDPRGRKGQWCVRVGTGIRTRARTESRQSWRYSMCIRPVDPCMHGSEGRGCGMF